MFNHGNPSVINPVAISFRSEQRLSDAGNERCIEWKVIAK
jgi:hypothetical protein